MILGKVFSPEAVIVNLESADKEEAFEEMIEKLAVINPGSNRQKMLEAVQEREIKMTTGIMHGIAVPHGRTAAVKGVQGVIGISRTGIEYDSLDHTPVHFIFMMLSSPSDCELHLRALKRLAQILEDPSFCESLLTQKDAASVHNLLCRYEASLA